MPNEDMDRLNRLAAAYGVTEESLGTVADAVRQNTTYVLSTANEHAAVMEVIATAVSDSDTFAALLAKRDPEDQVVDLLQRRVDLHSPTTPAATIVTEVLGEISRALNENQNDALTN